MPRRNKQRRALGLPAMQPAPVCDKCGSVHVSKRCMNGGNKPRNRRAINLNDPQSAAETIKRYADAEYIEELKGLL